MGARFATIIAVFSLAYGFLLFHLYQVQVMKGGYYAARAASQAEAADGGSSRGAIYFTDSNGNTLPAAVNEDFPIIYAVPKDIADIQEAANILSPIVDIPAANLLKLFSKPKDQYETILRKADKTVAQQIENLKLAGIYTTIESERVYSFDSAGSQVLGYVGPNASNTGESGHYGIESFYNSKLTGTGAMLLGGDVQLTIDPNIQVEAEKVLNDMVKAQHATGGSVIVMDPRTGKILAMGGNPSFDPNNYHDAPIKNFVNTMVQGVYEPGSIFKVLTMAAGLDSGKVTPQTTYNDTGTVKINGYTLTNYDYGTHGGYGPGTTMSNIIEHSINTGAIFVENKTGNDTFLSYMKKFGLDQPTGVDLPGEATGNLRPLTPNRMGHSIVRAGRCGNTSCACFGGRGARKWWCVDASIHQRRAPAANHPPSYQYDNSRASYQDDGFGGGPRGRGDGFRIFARGKDGQCLYPRPRTWRLYRQAH